MVSLILAEKDIKSLEEFMKTALRILSFFLVVTMVCAIGAPARAEPKPWIWGWWPSHWRNLDFKPYIEDSQQTHNSQWDDSNWEPEHWIGQRKSGRDLIRGFYFADILRDQYVDDDIPVLVVGPGFYMLGGQDKRRVVDTVDYVYQITEAHPNGMFMLRDWRTDKEIGSYTHYGLQMQ
jgi:hypothetical protein